MSFQPNYYRHSETDERNLFKPIRVGKMDLNHRIAMPPLTRFRAVEHVPRDQVVGDYYEQRAQEPGTLLITEATYISPRSVGYPGALAPGIWSPEQIDAWKKIFSRIHAKGSYVFVQLWALGRAADPEEMRKIGQKRVSASDVAMSGSPEEKPSPLTKEEIKEYIQDWVQAAKNAVDAGADGVELHGANGYLVDQFLRENTNKRTDEYGGSIENRARFLLEIIDALVEAIGAERVGVRMSPWGDFNEVAYDISPIPQFSYIVTELQRRANAGKQLAYLHVVEPRVSGIIDKDDTDFPTDANEFITKIWSGIIIRAGNLRHYAHDVANLDNRTIVALGRYFISNPDLVNRMREGKELSHYGRSKFYWDVENGDPREGYTDYPNA